ncbi:hypothetical protein [Micromonospora sp. NBC_00421]|uniref:hypothetical protein n=1 Tax=Micromonospora sp. NBC_00421 TaxID=2975976 RepID=UPI002E2394BC
MPLSRLAQQFADEIRQHDWSDAPYRADRAGHDRADDRHPTEQLDDAHTHRLTMNVMWVTAQVLGYNDPNFDVYEYAEACGVNTLARSGRRDGGILAGLRLGSNGCMQPGTRIDR